MVKDRYQKCVKPDCDRLVKVGVHYCCDACHSADARGYEIHESGPLAHSEACNLRHAERGPASLVDRVFSWHSPASPPSP